MKVIVITSNIAPYRLLWCEELSKFYDVTVYYTKDREKDYNDEFLKHSSDNCRIVKIENSRNDGGDPFCPEITKIIKENKDACIIFDGYGPITNLYGLLYCKLHGIRTFVNVDGYPTVRKKNTVVDIVKRFVISFLCTDFFCSGIACKEHLIKYGAKSDHIYIHNFSSIRDSQVLDKPLNKEEKINIRKQLGIEYNGDIVLGVGRFIPLKRFEDLIEAVLKCQKECHLYILGGKPTQEYLEKAKGSDRIHFIDFVLPEEVDKYYEMADLFVLPSETDVWGLVINEAMAKGLPVISSDSPVASRSLVDGNGYIFKTYDVEELSKDIDLCLEEENNKKMALKSLEIIRSFTIEEMVKRQKPAIDDYLKNR